MKIHKKKIDESIVQESLERMKAGIFCAAHITAIAERKGMTRDEAREFCNRIIQRNRIMEKIERVEPFPTYRWVQEYPGEMIECECGCGTMIKKLDGFGRKRRFVNFHSLRRKL